MKCYSIAASPLGSVGVPVRTGHDAAGLAMQPQLKTGQTQQFVLLRFGLERGRAVPHLHHRRHTWQRQLMPIIMSDIDMRIDTAE